MVIRIVRCAPHHHHYHAPGRPPAPPLRSTIRSVPLAAASSSLPSLPSPSPPQQLQLFQQFQFRSHSDRNHLQNDQAEGSAALSTRSRDEQANQTQEERNNRDAEGMGIGSADDDSSGDCVECDAKDREEEQEDRNEGPRFPNLSALGVNIHVTPTGGIVFSPLWFFGLQNLLQMMMLLRPSSAIFRMQQHEERPLRPPTNPLDGLPDFDYTPEGLLSAPKKAKDAAKKELSQHNLWGRFKKWIRRKRVTTKQEKPQ